MKSNVSNVLKLKVLILALTVSFSSCNKDSMQIDPDKARLVRILQYSSSKASDPSGEIVYAYDKAGNMAKEEIYDLNHGKILVVYREYEYSGNKLTKMKIFDGTAGNPTLGTYYEYKYEGDRLIKEELYCGRGCYGSFIHSVNFEYDNRGNLVREYRFEPDLIERFGGRVYADGIINDTKYVYDNQNRLITVLSSDYAGGVDGVDYFFVEYPSQKYEYDNVGRVIKVEYYDYSGFIQYVQKIYSGTSKLPEKELYFDVNGNQTTEIKYQHYYDEWGNLTETVINDECSMFKRKYKGKLLMEEIHYWSSYGWGGCSERGMSRYEYESK